MRTWGCGSRIIKARYSSPLRKLSALKTGFSARFAISMLLLAALLASSGCVALLEDEKLIVTEHLVTQNSKPPVEQTEVANYDEFKEALLDLVMQHAETAQILYTSFDEDVQSDFERASSELQSNDPICAYAVAEITAQYTKIVSYFEIEINIEYRRTKQQVDSIVAVSTTRYLRTELLSVMSDYRDEALIQTTLSGVKAADMLNYVRETYYDNPRTIVMMPVTAVEIFPEEGPDKIFELRFAYSQPDDFLRQYGESLSKAVRLCAAVAGGDNDGEILLSLAERLIGACEYDAGTANVISEHGTQNLSATAYGALVLGSAVGEGFAMAYKALCKELDYDCTVVLGYYDGMVHAWNVVSLYGDYYHIDLSMCAENGIETAFLKTDVEMMEHYTWDFVNTAPCRGDLTYEEIAGIEPPDTEDPTEEIDEEGNPIQQPDIGDDEEGVTVDDDGETPDDGAESPEDVPDGESPSPQPDEELIPEEDEAN